MRLSRPPDSHRCQIVLFVLTVALVATSPPSWGLDFASELLVYRESYVGESAYPLTPEVDELGAGGLLGAGSAGFAPDPVLTGAVATASLVAGGGWLTGVVFVGGPFGNESIGFRGLYANVVLPVDSLALISTGAGFDAGVNGVGVRAGLEISRDALGVAQGVLAVSEQDGGTPLPISELDALSAAEASAITSGASFVLDVVVDRVAGTATSTIDIDGFPTRTAGPLTLSLIGSSELQSAGQLLLTGTSVVDSQTAAVDFTAFEVYRVFTTSFIVDTNVDEVDATIGDADCEAASTFCSLRAAIQESNAIPGPGEIIIPADTYALTIAGAEEDAAATGDLDITEELVLRGAGRDTTLIDAGGIDRVFEIPGGAIDEMIHLYDVTIRNGAAVTGGGATGGGIENYGSLVLARCIVSGNQANLAAGILNRGTLDMDDCVVKQNDALDLGFTNARVGGLASASTSAPGANPVATIRNSAIVDNTAPNIGGAELGGADFALIENTTFSGNTNPQVRIFNSDVVFEHVTIVGDLGEGLSAGSFSGTHTLQFTNSAIDGTPACNLSTTFPVVAIYSGHNASNDTSCGFSASGSSEGVGLGLLPLATIGDSRAHVPGASSILIDTADPAPCLPADQVGTARPADGDESGTAECDIGAIEVPEPAPWPSLAAGIVFLMAMVRRRKKRSS